MHCEDDSCTDGLRFNGILQLCGDKSDPNVGLNLAPNTVQVRYQQQIIECKETLKLDCITNTLGYKLLVNAQLELQHDVQRTFSIS